MEFKRFAFIRIPAGRAHESPINLSVARLNPWQAVSSAVDHWRATALLNCRRETAARPMHENTRHRGDQPQRQSDGGRDRTSCRDG
jgi:P2-related tail formation protein